MAALPPNLVHRGFWIDYTRGSVFGATITTTSSDGNLIIAILSLLISFTGAHLWDLFAFIRFWSNVKREDRSAYFHQRQVLYRNITSPGAFLLEIIKLVSSWRFDHPWTYSASDIVFALVCSAGFLIAGIFVSLVVSTSDLQVLVRSDACGMLSWRNETTNLNLQYQNLIFTQAQNFRDLCYNMTSAPTVCKAFVKPSIQLETVSDAECPFQDGCTNHSALRLNTGLLDSNEVFGINYAPEFAVKLQRVMTCAPLEQKRYFAARPMPADNGGNRQTFPGEQLYEWFLGPLTTRQHPIFATFSQSSYTPLFAKAYALTFRSYYVPTEPGILDQPHSSTFVPIPELRRTDADTHLIGIQYNGVRFYYPNDDPIFSAHVKEGVLFDNDQNTTMYTGDNPATILGCTEQTRFCFTQGNCTPLLGMDAAYSQARKIAPTDIQKRTLFYLFFQLPTMYNANYARMLVLRNTASFQAGIPSYQWKLEVRAWFNFLLAVTHTTIPHIAAGPVIAHSDFNSIAKSLKGDDICNRQRMGAPDGYSNINVFGLAIIISLSSLVTSCNLLIVPALKLLDRYNVWSSLEIKAWVQEGSLQLQRRAYEAAGYSQWTRLERDVPIPKDNPALPALSMAVLNSRTDIEALENNKTTDQPGSPTLLCSTIQPSPSFQATEHTPNSDASGIVSCAPETARQDLSSPSPSLPSVSNAPISTMTLTSLSLNAVSSPDGQPLESEPSERSEPRDN